MIWLRCYILPAQLVDLKEQCEGAEITLVSRERRNFTVGEILHLTVKPENMHIFDSEKGQSIT